MNTDLQEGTFQSGIAHTKAAADNSLAALTDTDSAFNEDQALAVLKNRDLPSEILEQISKNGRLVKLRRVRLAIVVHPRTPRHVSLPLLRGLYSFDLARVALLAAVPADIKAAADELLITRLATITAGEKLSLAKRGSARIAGALMHDADARITKAVLENPRLTEASIVKAISRRDARESLIAEICRHPKWSLRQEIRITLLQNERIPLARALQFAQGIPYRQLLDVLHHSRLPGPTKELLLKQARATRKLRP